MAKKIAGYTPNDVRGGTLATSVTYADVVEGAFAGWDSSGTVKLGDYRASQGPIVGMGALLQSSIRKDPLGNTLATGTQVSFVPNAKIAGMTDVAGAALTPGTIYYLSSGGAVTKTKPAATTNDIDQMVGVAVSTSELQIQLGQPIVHA